MQPAPAEQLHRVNVAIAPVRWNPATDAIRTNEALYGDRVDVLSRQGDWLAICQLRDGYTGFVHARHLQAVDSATYSPNTHWVTQRSTLLFQSPDIKSPLQHRIPFGAELALMDRVSDSFSRCACGHYVWTAHCRPLSEPYPTGPLELAESLFLGTVYLWGGRSPEGIDCSGLIQMLARSQGYFLPRDSGEQEEFLRADVRAGDYRTMDLVFWPGHTGILTSPTTILHATAHSLSCVIEPLENVIARAGPVSSVKRLF